MAHVTRARILRGERERNEIGAATVPANEHGRARIVSRHVAGAHDDARQIIGAAEARAQQLLEAARLESDRHAARREAELRADADARIAAALLALRAEDERRTERDVERLESTAVVLAERLIGEALAIEPARIGAMAQAALREARGVRRVVLEANPLDAATVKAQLEVLGLPEGTVSVEISADLARGDLLLKTNLGTIDARLKPQLQRLAEALSRARRAQ
jgi:flagellar assembly protein FliH/type III secretion protein L